MAEQHEPVDWAAPVDDITTQLRTTTVSEGSQKTKTETTTTTTSVSDESTQTDKPDERDLAISRAATLVDCDTENISVQASEVSNAVDLPELISEVTWEDMKLSQALLDGIADIGYKRPSKIQGLAIPAILAGNNFVGQAQSGTGKTAAFALSILQLIDPNLHKTQAIILSPVRELCRQTFDVIKKLSQFTQISVALVVPESPDASLRNITHQVVVSTPGTCLTAIAKKSNLNTKSVKFFVLDEADEMLALQGLCDQSLKVHKELPRNCKVCLFSATYNQPVKDLVSTMIKQDQPQVSVFVKPEELTVKKLVQFFIECNSVEMKFRVLNTIYRKLPVGQSIIFCQTKESAKMLDKAMRGAGFEVSLIHGTDKDMATEQRDHVMDQFRNGVARVLIATNVLARGIDVLSVTLIINYDMPIIYNPNRYATPEVDCETYLHRVGRSARYGNSGVALNFIENTNQGRGLVQKLEHTFNAGSTKPLISRLAEEDIGTTIGPLLEEQVNQRG